MADLTDLGPWGVPMPFRIIIDQSAGVEGIAKQALGRIVLQDVNNNQIVLFDEVSGVSALISPSKGLLIQSVIASGTIVSVRRTRSGIVQLVTDRGMVVTI